jgi:hypothetical protein
LDRSYRIKHDTNWGELGFLKKGDSGNGSPRRWGWGIPLKKTIRHPNRKDF